MNPYASIGATLVYQVGGMKSVEKAVCIHDRGRFRDFISCGGKRVADPSPLTITAMTGSTQSLFLDPALRDWVLLPIFIVMIMVGVLRHYATILLRSDPKTEDLKAVREQSTPYPNRD